MDFNETQVAAIVIVTVMISFAMGTLWVLPNTETPVIYTGTVVGRGFRQAHGKGSRRTADLRGGVRMKLCQKCFDAISHAIEVHPEGAWWSVESGVPFSESDCEFWAHKKLNTLKFSLQVSAQRYVAKQTADCKHYDREESPKMTKLTEKQRDKLFAQYGGTMSLIRELEQFRRTCTYYNAVDYQGAGLLTNNEFKAFHDSTNHIMELLEAKAKKEEALLTEKVA